MRYLLSVVIVLSGVCNAAAHDASSTYILSVGNSQSYESGLKQLKYAVTDSVKFSRAMELVAQVPRQQVVSLKNQSLSDFKNKLNDTRDFLKQSRDIHKFVFYYSGHSDDRGLHFKDGLFTKEELHGFLKSIQVDSKISILDSCFSGALAAKGIEPVVREFQIPKSDYDEPTGTVFLTASSADESAFESETKKGSVFSHHLITGIYGDADANNDGLITVEELYLYVYRKTKYENILSPTGIKQQPEFVSELKGRGALVVSKPQSVSIPIRVDGPLVGSFTLMSIYGLQTYAFDKITKDSMTVSVPQGDYNLSLVSSSRVGHALIHAESGRTNSLTANDIDWTQSPNADSTVAKGPENEIKLANAIAQAPVNKSSLNETPVVDTSRMSSTLTTDRPAKTHTQWTAHSGLHERYIRQDQKGVYYQVEYSRWSFKYQQHVLIANIYARLQNSALETAESRGEMNVYAGGLAVMTTIYNDSSFSLMPYFGTGYILFEQRWGGPFGSVDRQGSNGLEFLPGIRLAYAFSPEWKGFANTQFDRVLMKNDSESSYITSSSYGLGLTRTF
jgi:hypothetical protein